MAVDTTNEKLALMSWTQPWQWPMPISADGLDQADNQQLLWGYPGVLWGETAESPDRIGLYGRVSLEPAIGFQSLSIRRR